MRALYSGMVVPRSGTESSLEAKELGSNPNPNPSPNPKPNPGPNPNPNPGPNPDPKPNPNPSPNPNPNPNPDPKPNPNQVLLGECASALRAQADANERAGRVLPYEA